MKIAWKIRIGSPFGIPYQINLPLKFALKYDESYEMSRFSILKINKSLLLRNPHAEPACGFRIQQKYERNNK